MNTSDLQTKLERLSTKQIRDLAIHANVSERALWRIRSGTTRTASEDLKAAVMVILSKIRIRTTKEKK